MTEQNETVVRVDTLKEYRAVLEKWFSKGYDWGTTRRSQDHHEEYFTESRGGYLILDEGYISHSAGKHVREENLKVTPFKEFMAKEQEATYGPISIGGIPERERDMVTYEVSEDQMVFIKEVKESPYPAAYLMGHNYVYEALFSAGDYGPEFERDLLRYLGGDDNVMFQEKDPLYLLKGKDSDGDTVYFTLDGVGAPTYVYDDEKSDAFKAPREEIIRWYTPFWKVEQADA